MSSYVIATHRSPGFHYWPGAPAEVDYLSYRHRHLFLFVAAFRIQDPDRQVEFHTAQKWIAEHFHDNKDYGHKSCEMICKDVRDALVGSGHPAPAWVEVWEDQEHGARVEFS